MSTSRLLIDITAGLFLTLPASASITNQEAFPSSTALAEGVSPDSLKKLRDLVQSFVDDQEVVGAELLVIKNGHSILHEGFGYKHRESEVAMRTGNVFCIRSMTKPFIGAAILMLVQDKQLRLSDRVSKYLPGFGGEDVKDITIEHLLTHSSGFPFSLIVALDLTTLENIQAVAALGANCELDSKPGTEFQYSDHGTDTLTAVVEVVTGVSAAEFVRTRILDPLEMKNTTCLLTADHPLRERVCSKYSGSRGNWGRFWDPESPTLLPFFLGSQGVYCTLEDYGRFMEFWLSEGRSREARLLRRSFVRKALRPSPYPARWNSGMPDVLADYGYLMQLWTAEVAQKGAEERTEREVIAFGHGGSDGTHAWVFPEQDAIVLYFTQSRMNLTGLRVEESLADLFLGAPFDPSVAAPPFEQYLGYYAEDDNSRYQAVIRDGEDLALETPGRRIRQLIYIGDDRWKFRAKPSVVLVFERSEQGHVTGFNVDGHREFRFQPAAGLPGVEEVAARVADTHRFDLLETLGPIRIDGTLRMDKIDVTADTSTVTCWPNRFRVDIVNGEHVERVAFDGERSWYASTETPAAELRGARADTIRDENPFSVFGNWLEWHPELQVIQRLKDAERDIVLVRTNGTSGPATTFYVDWSTGRLMRIERVSTVAGAGRVSQQTTFDDFRDVSGILLPFKSATMISPSFVGLIMTSVDDVELGVELPEGTFTLDG